MAEPNPRNCYTCKHAMIGEQVVCTVAAANWVPKDLSRIVKRLWKNVMRTKHQKERLLESA